MLLADGPVHHHCSRALPYQPARPFGSVTGPVRRHAAARRRRSAPPRAPIPSSESAQVAGSGTPPVLDSWVSVIPPVTSSSGAPTVNISKKWSPGPIACDRDAAVLVPPELATNTPEPGSPS